jgi:aldehyde:ferredoxin oxidoreductase
MAHTLSDMRAAHRLLAEYRYEPAPVDRGYAGRTLYVNLSDHAIASKPVTDEMKEKFVGGKGFGLWLLWHGVQDRTRWNDPENEIVIAAGPIGGITTYPGSGKSIVVSISPTTHSVMDSNVGGYFGPYLKFAGWDAIEIQGKAERDVIVFIDGDTGRVTIEEAPLEAVDSHVLAEQIVEMYGQTPQERRAISSVSAGIGAEHTLMGCLNFSFYDIRRQIPRIKQAGRGGIGTVFRDKKVKALVVKFTGLKSTSNQPADLGRLQEVGAKMHRELHDYDAVQCKMRSRGTAHLVEIMDDYDLLPTHNFRFGRHPDTHRIASDVWEKRFTQGIPDGCWYGCTMACTHAVDHYTLRTGPYKGQVVSVDGPEYETVAALGSNCGIFDPEHIIEANFYCDTYGIDTISVGTTMAFVMECYEAGVIDTQITGGLDLRFGNADAAMELLHQMGHGEGFGALVGQGVRRLKEHFADAHGVDAGFLHDIGMEVKGLEYSEYVTKESLAQQGGYAMASKGPQHDEAWLIFMDMVNNQIPTFEDKAEALHYFPLWRTWFGLCGLCKLPWNDIEPPDNAQTAEPAKVPEHVDNYAQLFRAVTGREVSPQDLIRMSERVYNFQRLFNYRLGFGTREHDYGPYRAMGPVTAEEYESRAERYDQQLQELVGVDPAGKSTTEKMAALRAHREAQYEQLIDATYKRRGWSPDGVPTLETLRRLGIDYPDVVRVAQNAGR